MFPVSLYPSNKVIQCNDEKSELTICGGGRSNSKQQETPNPFRMGKKPIDPTGNCPGKPSSLGTESSTSYWEVGRRGRKWEEKQRKSEVLLMTDPHCRGQEMGAVADELREGNGQNHIWINFPGMRDELGFRGFLGEWTSE